MHPDSEIRLTPMSPSQFDSYFEMSSADYARVSPHYRDLPAAEALEKSKAETKKLAPEGLQTPGHHFLAILKGEEQIGYLHFSEYPKGTSSAYAWNFYLYEPFRKQGLGKKAMIQAQTYLKDAGFQKISLNVIAGNTTAIKLYESFGFEITQMNMERKL